MTITRWGFESGANNDTLTPTHASADSVVATGGTAVISTAHAAHGTRSALFTNTGVSGGNYLQKSLGGALTEVAVAVYFRVATLPSADTTILWLGLGASQRCHVELTSTGAVRFRDDANAARWNGTVTTSTGTISTGTWYRLELHVTASATTGTFHLVVYPRDSITPVTGMDSGAMTAQNTGADGFDSLRIGGKASTNATTGSLNIDSWSLDDAPTGLIGPWAEQLPTPVVSCTSTNPTTLGGSDGTITATWAAVTGADSYDLSLDGGATIHASNVTSPHVVEDLTAGDYFVAVKAIA